MKLLFLLDKFLSIVCINSGDLPLIVNSNVTGQPIAISPYIDLDLGASSCQILSNFYLLRQFWQQFG
jgi:hypothetical protein